jgi:AraC-like DNA-binding protein
MNKIEREAEKEHLYRTELIERIAHAVREDAMIEPMPGVFVRRFSAPTEPVHGIVGPAFCVIAQGRKEVVVGEERYRYDPYHYLLATVELPVIGQVMEGSPDKPYLAVRLDLNPVVVGSVMVEAGLTAPQEDTGVKAINVSPLDAGLLDATVRLIRLIDSPSEARILTPLVTREIIFRLLMGEQGERLRHLVALGGYASRIAKAMDQIRHNFNRPIRIEHLARELGMSASGLHHQFKSVTTMTPLQFQKQLRLQEARRLMLGEDMDAATACYRVGYEDTSQFSREYKRLFGLPPLRDVGRLREAVSSRENK